MKKYLMIGASALTIGAMFTSCGNDEVSVTDYYQAVYEQKFVEVFGQPSSNQEWGFSASGSTRANPGESYPATHTYTDASGNVIAGANMNHNEWADPDKEFGGWVVPDALTDGQKLRVQKYFQANPNLAYEDPHFRHFFVQQVYTGGTSAPTTGNKESTVGADGQAHQGMTLNQLTVGEACSHINDFNAGTCSPSQVLDNGSNVNSGTYHSDQITLMVNVYDTSCFGYHETSGSNVNPNNNHNDKMALVSAATIDAWAAANGNPGEAVVDKWNRSFMGFDYELLPESDIVLDSYAMLSNWDGNLPQYAWDGTDVMVIGSAPEATQAEELDITSTFALDPRLNNVTCSYDSNGYIVCNFTGQYYNAIQFYQNADWRSYDKLVIEFAEPSPISATINSNNGDVQINVGDTQVEVPTPDYIYNNNGGPTISNSGIGTTPVTLTIKSVKLVKEASAPDPSTKYYTSEYLLAGGTDQISFYSTNTNMYGGVLKSVSSADMTTTIDGKTCINLKWIKEELLDKGYHPISTDLKTWVKWQAACDGYYSDWIVTLTEAKRITPDDPIIPGGPTKKSIRIMAEDVSASDASDFDFNDVVFDVEAEFPEGIESVNQVKITLWAAGGTLPLRINSVGGNGGFEVHNAMGITDFKTMINTHAESYAGTFDGVTYKWQDNVPEYSTTITLANSAKISKDDFEADVNENLRVEVEKTEGNWILLTAERGRPACKIGCPVGTPWALEKHNMNSAFTSFKAWVNNGTPTNWYSSKTNAQIYNSGDNVIYGKFE